MNSRVLCAVALLLVPASAFAQEIGVKVGINAASLTPEEDESPDTSRRFGPVGGIWFRAPSAARVSLHVEGLYSEKGVHFDVTALGLDSRAEVRVRYFEIPVLARADLGAAGSATRIFVVGGLAPAFELSAWAKTEFNGEERTRDIDNEIESVDVGLVGGVGIGFGRSSIEARYTHGLRRINTDNNDPEDRIQNRVLSVAFGLRF
jgi:Outer membrane protein beta-barrel domain